MSLNLHTYIRLCTWDEKLVNHSITYVHICIIFQILFAIIVIACISCNCINGSALGRLPLGSGGQRGLFGLNLGILTSNQVGQVGQNSTFGLGIFSFAGSVICENVTIAFFISQALTSQAKTNILFRWFCVISKI